MRLLRYGVPGQERPGILDNEGRIRELSTIVKDISGDVLTSAVLTAISRTDIDSLPLVEGTPRLGPCIGRVGKIICIGLNYVDHAAETAQSVPKEPVIFFKATSAINGPNDDVILPPDSVQTDWEVELGVVIGDAARYVSEDNALRHVAGYCIINDISERDYQLNRSGQWVKGKSCDTFCPLGPYFVFRDAVTDPQRLQLRLDVNDRRVQDGSTEAMIFSVSHLVSYLSQFMSLQPGDIISTGTPAGVGMACKPPVFLKPGDVMTASIDGLGEQRQRVRSFNKSFSP